MSHETGRRSFIKHCVAAPAAAALTLQARAGGIETPPPGQEAAKAPLPCGRIGDLEVSRLLLGGNLLTHFTHSRDLNYVYKLAEHYNTNEKILDTLAVAEHHGINTLVIHTVPETMDLLKKYRYEMGGMIQWIICPTAPMDKDLGEFAAQVKELVEMGAEAVYIWGVRSDELASSGRADILRKAVELVKEQGKPVGVGAHDCLVLKECMKYKVDPDFFVKTLHHHNYPTAPAPEERVRAYNEIPGYWCKDPQEVIAFMQECEKPWIGFKVMAAGAIPPADAFQYAFESGVDHVLAGMFDFEVAEDTALIRDLVANVSRSRPWRS